MSNRKKLIVEILLGVLVAVSLVSPFAKAIAYDSTPIDEEGSLLRYYIDDYGPAVTAPEMNLESFVNETLKGILIGFPFYVLSRTFIGCLINTAIIFTTRDQGVISFLIPDWLEFINSLISAARTADCGWLAEILLRNRDLFSSTTLQPYFAAHSMPPILKVVAGLASGPRVSLGQQVQFFAQQLNITTPSYAQASTFGYSALESIIPYWRAVRNMAYALSAVALVLAGFAIMFRVKISPQLIVTLENTIPKAIIALILVTFSYAIVGFILDLTWVVPLLILRALAAEGFFGNYAESIIPDLTRYNAVAFMLENGFIPGFVASLMGVGAAIEAMLGGIAGAISQFLMLIGFLILGFIVFFAMVKIVWNLIKAYVTLLIFTIFGPLMIISGILPGVDGFGNWFKNVISQAIVFPATAILLSIALALMTAHSRFSASSDRSQIIMLGNIDTVYIIALGGLGIVLTCASIVKNLQETIKRSMRLETAGALWLQKTAQGAQQMAVGYGKQVAMDRNYIRMRERAPDADVTKKQRFVSRVLSSQGFKPSAEPPGEGPARLPVAHEDEHA